MMTERFKMTDLIAAALTEKAQESLQQTERPSAPP